MENKSVQFIFDGDKVIISPNLIPIIKFLEEIEKEIETFLKFDKKLETIKKQYTEIVGLIRELGKKIKENSIDFKYTLSEDPSTIVDKLSISRPIRSEIIILFAYLEVLLCLNIAYENKISNQKTIINKTMDKKIITSFYNDFCLNKENEWGQRNPERLKNITADNLRKLRNSLTHFFAVDRDIFLSYAILDTKSRKLEKITNFKVKFVSPEDLYEIIRGAGILMIKKWDSDYKESLTENSEDFKEKILSALDIVKTYAPVIVKEGEINI